MSTEANPTKYFRKHSPKIKVFQQDGKPVPVEIFGNIGYVITTDPMLIWGINKMISEHRGGFEEISKDEYDLRVTKKNLNERPFGQRFIETRQTSGRITDPRHLAEAAARAAVVTSPVYTRPTPTPAPAVAVPVAPPAPNIPSPRVGKVTKV